MTLKENYMQFTKAVPLRTAYLKHGTITYRYYRNSRRLAPDVTLVFLAGGTGLGDSFFYMYESLLPNYSFISFTYPMDFPTNASLADAMAELFEQIGARNIYLVGQSYGGLLAQVTARRHPRLIKGMILSGTCSLSNDLDFEGIQNLVHMINPDKTRKSLRMDTYLPMFLLFPLFKWMCRRTIADKKAAELCSGIFDLLKGELSHAYLAHMDTLLGDLITEFGTHRPEDFEPFRNEVLLFFSRDDQIFCNSLKDALIRLMPDPVIVPDLKGGHLAMLLSCEDYLSALDSFLAERNV